MLDCNEDSEEVADPSRKRARRRGPTNYVLKRKWQMSPSCMT